MSELLTALVVLIAAIPFACRPASAQNVGDRVRVTTAADTVIGDLSQTNDGGLLVLVDGESREFTHAEVHRLEIEMATGHREWWGLILGGSLGLRVAEETAPEIEVTSMRCAPNPFGECGRKEPEIVPAKEVTTAGVATVMAGLAGGYLVGRLLKSRTWQEVTPVVDAQPGQVITGIRVRL